MVQEKTAISNFFSKLTFNEEFHKYYVNDTPLEYSASTLVKKFVKFVDYESIARKKDLTLGLPEGTHKIFWDNKALKATSSGDKAHFFGEIYAFHRNIVPTDPLENAIATFWRELPDYILPVFTELQMYHLNYMFGGTADIILYNTLTKKFIIGDYKTNEDLSKNFMGKTLLPPFEFLLENDLNKYQIQFSIYQILFEQTGFEVEKRVLIWLRPDGTYEKYFTEDYTQLIKNYLIKC